MCCLDQSTNTKVLKKKADRWLRVTTQKRDSWVQGIVRCLGNLLSPTVGDTSHTALLCINRVNTPVNTLNRLGTQVAALFLSVSCIMIVVLNSFQNTLNLCGQNTFKCRKMTYCWRSTILNMFVNGILLIRKQLYIYFPSKYWYFYSLCF